MDSSNSNGTCVPNTSFYGSSRRQKEIMMRVQGVTRWKESREKITDESLEIKSALATFIEETVNEHCTTEEVANKILNGKKSIKDLIHSITEEARKKAVDNIAAISDKEVKEMVLKYYELDETKAHITEVVDILDLI